MNAVAFRLLGIALTIALLTLIFVWFSRREVVQRVKENVSWLLKASFFDFVRMIIFIKPLKNYTEPIGILLWLLLVFIVGRYLIVDQPATSEIPGPYIPMIGYVYFVSVLFIVHIVLRVAGGRE